MFDGSYILELHKREYSVFDAKCIELSALKELHDHSYMIFDENESYQLYADFERELKLTRKETIQESLESVSEMTSVFVQNKHNIKSTDEIRYKDHKDGIDTDVRKAILEIMDALQS